MYYDFFNLNEHPFCLSTDPRFLYLSSGHSQAKAYMEYALRNNDKLFILSGEIGSGKSLIIQDNSVQVYKIHQTLLDNIEFLQMLLREFGIKSFHSRKVELIDQIYDFLVQQCKNKKRVVLIVDEAQNLKNEVLEEVRLLLDLDYQGQKLMSLFLVGQPELDHKIDQPEMEQLRQRARLRFHLDELDIDDTEKYIIHRLCVAGENHSVVIDKEAYPFIQTYSGGRPRLINVLMDHALTYAFVEGLKTISAENILKSVSELNWAPFGEPVDDVHSTSDTTHDQLVVSKKIVVRKNGICKGEYPINKSRLNIGRHGDNDIVLGEPRISRIHAQIMVNGDEIIIQDLNSKNGTYTGSKKIDVYPMAKGDVITIASFELTFTELDDESRDDTTDSVNILQYPFSANLKN